MKPEPGTKTRQVIETEVLPQNSHSEATAAEFYDRDFWEVIGDISRLKLWGNHLVRVYRANDQWEKTGAPENNKFTDSFNEETLRKNWGGGNYLLWLYGPPSGTKLVMRPYRLPLDGPPRAAAMATTQGATNEGPLMVVLQELLAELRASRGGNLGETAMQNALNIQFRAMEQALTLTRPASAGSLGDDLLKSLLAALIPALITKFTNPANPVEDFSKVASAAKELVGLLGGGKGEGKPDTLSTIVNALPTVIEKAAGGLKEIRLAAEAQERAARIAQGRIIEVQPTPAPTAAGVDTSAAPPSEPARPASPETQPQRLTREEEDQMAYGLFLRGTFQRLAKMIQDDPHCDGETVFNFVETMAPEMIPQLKAATREQIITYFRSDEVLKQIADHPRLPQIIDEFLKIAKEDE